MAKIDQRKYLKKYLEDDHSDHRKKRKREHTDSRSGRVKIIDDDADYSRKRNYEEDTDLHLTGEDAPQVVGVIDDRPPELKTMEDFRGSSKWKSVPISKSHVGERSRNDNRYVKDSSKHDRRRSSSSGKDLSPRRPDRSETNTKRRSTPDDYSPPRRKRDHEPKKQQANLYKREKSSSYSDHSHKRGDDWQSRGKNSDRYRKSHSAEKEGSSYRTSSAHYSDRRHSPPQPTSTQKPFYDRRKQQENFASETTGRFRGGDFRSADTRPYSGSSAGYDRKVREEPVKFNPFRSNPPPAVQQPPTIQHSIGEQFRRRSPVAKPNNPFRSNPNPNSLSPIPDRRGPAGPPPSSNGRNSFRSQQLPETTTGGTRFDERPKFDFKNGSTHSSADTRRGFNPFRADNKPRELSPLPAIRGGGGGGNEKNIRRNDTVAPPLRSHIEPKHNIAPPPLRSYIEPKHNMPRETYFRPDIKDKSRRDWNSNGSNAFRSNSPPKTDNRIYNQSQQKSDNSHYDSERRNQTSNRSGRKTRFSSRQRSRDLSPPSPQRKLASQISDTRYQPASNYSSSKKERWDDLEYRRR